MLDENIENNAADEVQTSENTENLPKKETDVKDAVTSDAANLETDVNATIEQEKPTEVTSAATNTEEDSVPAKIEVKEEKLPPKKEETVGVDYASFDLDALVASLQKLLKNEPVHSIKNDVEKIKTNFNTKFGALLREKKKAFLDDGGSEIDFQYHSPIKSQYNDLLFEYKVKREKYYKEQKEEQQENLTKRLAIIEEIKTLIDTAEPSNMYKQFRELQVKWQAAGKIPHVNYNDVWRTYHHHVERFYDLLHLNNDFRDLDFKHNLDEKLKLVERAEALTTETDVNKAFKELQILHRLWKEDIGPVAKEFREEVWGKFSAATKIIHGKRHDFQKHLESKYEGNVALKEDVIVQISKLIENEKMVLIQPGNKKLKS